MQIGGGCLLSQDGVAAAVSFTLPLGSSIHPWASMIGAVAEEGGTVVDSLGEGVFI